MTGEQSRQLKIGDRVCQERDHDERGTVTAIDWSGVKINSDPGLASEIMHNDMEKIEAEK